MKISVVTKKSGPFLDPFWSKIWAFLLKNQVFGHFLRNRTSDLSKASSETGDNCFESSNGSVVSGKILVLLFIYYHFYSFVIGRRHFYVFFYLGAAERPQHCALVAL